MMPKFEKVLQHMVRNQSFVIEESVQVEAEKLSGLYAEDVVFRHWGISPHQIRKILH